MSTFLQKIKKNKSETNLLRAQEKEMEDKNPEDAVDLVPVSVDMSKTNKEVVVVAHIPGVEARTVKVSLEGENDILVIEGENNSPQIWREKITKTRREDPVKAGLAVKTGAMRECKYGQFYRKIVLPEEVVFKKQNVTVANGTVAVYLQLYNPNNS